VRQKCATDGESDSASIAVSSASPSAPVRPARHEWYAVCAVAHANPRSACNRNPFDKDGAA
jgi:hypothetical protein